MEVVSAILYQLTKNLPEDETSEMFAKLDCSIPEFEFSGYSTKENVLLLLHEDMVAEQKAQCLYETILSNVHNTEVSDPIRFLRAREIVHYQRLGEAISIVQDHMDSKNFDALNPAFPEDFSK